MAAGWVWSMAAPLGVLLLAALATRAVIGLLLRHAVLDHPNRRSSHASPVPRGGGIAVMAAIAAGWIAYALTMPALLPVMALLLAAAAGLAAISFLDDLFDLTAAMRLLAQLLAVLLGMLVLADAGPVFQGLLPGWLDLLAAALLWLWFVNLFNFMDGIDGMAGVQTVALALGLVLVGISAGAGGGTGAGPDAGIGAAWQPPLLMLAAAAAGFLWFNWQPARLFLGDVGSVPLGYLLGFLLLSAAAAGQWAAALILPAYYLADASITLVRRVLRGEKFWHGHREHFYQQAVRRGFSHATVSTMVAGGNALLILLAMLAAAGHELPALAGAALVTAGLLGWMVRARPKGTS
jgi:UDP-N-acetylmuramyl pentapeptide phosphotransferase/UDP-N-acetylglucosamine-1-phosphate transferase